MIFRTFGRFRSYVLPVACVAWLMAAVTPLWAAQANRRDSVDALLADRFATLAMLMVAGSEKLDDDRLTGSRLLLDLALELSPEDAELWRLRREHAQRMGDVEAERRALSAYCRLRPQDDVAQADLILMSLRRQGTQTLEQRVATIERLINSDLGKSLSPALRSRLASYVAVAAREMGNNALFSSWLKYALRTDSTNVVAARLTYDLVIERNAPPYDIALALQGLLRANPIEASTHQRLGELLLTYGVYDRAAEQFEVAQMLATEPGSPGFYHSWASALAASGRSDDALELISSYERLLVQRQQQAEQRTADQEADASAPDAPNRDTVAADGDAKVLPPEMQMLRLSIQSGFNTVPASAIASIRELYQSQIEAGSALAQVKLAWTLALFNIDPAEVQQLTQAIAAARGEDDLTVYRLRGWLALHADDRDTALQYLQPIAEVDAYAAYGLSRLLRASDPAQSTRWRRLAVQLEPASLPGVLAARELHDAGERAEMTEVGVGLNQMLRSWPITMLRPDPLRRPWMGVSIEMDTQRPGYLDPMIAKITIRNTTNMPLSFAPEGALPTQLFVYISTRQAGRALGSLPPIIVDVHRRLRLEPNEAIEIEVPLHRGPFGVALRQLAGQTLTFSATAVLDPRPTPRGHVVNGPLGATTTLNLVEVTGATASVPHVERWLGALEQPDRRARSRALAHLVQLAPALAGVEGGAELSQRIVTTVNRIYPDLDPVTQAWTLMFLPGDETGRAMFERVHQAAQRSNEPIVRIAYMMAQVSDPASTQITADMRHEDPRISVFARVKRKLLQEQQEQQQQQQPGARP